MALRDTLQRVNERLAALDLTDAAASRKAGLSADALRNMRRALKENKQQAGTLASWRKIARALETNVRWLVDGEGDAAATSETVPVVGYVGAGSAAILYADSQGPFDQVEAPADSSENTVALTVQGVSLGPVFDEAIVFYDDVRSPVTADLHGRLCVVGLMDGRVLVKLLRSAGDGTYHLFSNAADQPLLNEEVAWAARVTGVKPR